MKFDALMRNPSLKYLLMALLPMAVLLYTPTSNLVVLHFGEKILLETLPVDPRDVLRGDYVVLTYEIQDIPDEMMPDGVQEERGVRSMGRRLYVSLERAGDGIAHISGVSLKRPQGLYLRGTAQTSWRSVGDIDYNLGVYYVPEGRGRELEEAINGGRVLAEVRVLRGRGVIKNMEVVEP